MRQHWQKYQFNLAKIIATQWKHSDLLTKKNAEESAFKKRNNCQSSKQHAVIM
jgi:hypothetical protein